MSTIELQYNKGTFKMKLLIIFLILTISFAVAVSLEERIEALEYQLNVTDKVVDILMKAVHVHGQVLKKLAIQNITYT